MHLGDGSSLDILGAGDICLSLPSGALYTLCHVRYIPQLRQSLILARELADSECRTLFREGSL